MYGHTQELLFSPTNSILAEVEVVRLRPYRTFPRIRRRWERWCNEEQFGLLVIGLGNVCFFSVVCWWIF